MAVSIAAGEWGDLFEWPIIGVHTILAPDGRILTFGTDQEGMQGGELYYDVWDPVTGIHQTLENTTKTNVFCSAAIIIPETGEIIISGGDAGPGGPFNQGISEVNIFDYRDSGLERSTDGDMIYQRWYPSLVTLHSGQIVIFGGKNIEGNGVGTPEIYTPGEGWRALNGAASDEISEDWWYPRAWVNSSGKIISFAVDWTEDTVNIVSLDPAGDGSLENLGALAITTNYLLPAIMFEQDKVLLIGDNGEAWVMDISGETVSLEATGELGQNRDWANMTVLADGTVMVSGGSDGDNNLDTAYNEVALWNPDTGEWSFGTDAAVARLYHSTTILLQDGTVLSLGGGAPGPLTNLNGEIYTPYYLLDEFGELKERPEIISAPDQIEIGKTFTITVEDSAAITKINLVKTGAVTHSLNMDSNLVSLDYTATSATEIQVSMPAADNAINPGYWMLFIFDEAGTPSLAPILHVPPTVAYFEGDPGILVFRDGEFEGIAQSFGEGIYEASKGDFDIIGNDTISSLRIPDGYEVFVAANDSSGGAIDKVKLTSDTDLAANGLDNSISLIEVIKIAPPVSNLIARDDGAAVLEDGIAVSGNVLTNDEDIDGQAFSVTQVNGQTANVGQIVKLASGLKVSIDALGDFSVDPDIAYQNLAAGVDAQESIAYQITDSSGAIATANLVVTITGTNDVPTVSAVTASTAEDQIVTGQLTATDPDGDQLSFAISGNTPEGLRLNTDGSWSFDPGDRFVDLAENESATIAFQYTATDATTTSDPAAVTITVEGKDAAPPFLSYQDDPAVTQYLEGTEGEDAFIIAGSFQTYGWGATSDGGVVVWPHGDGPHDIVYDFEQIRFDDGFIRINPDGTLSLESYSGSGVTYNDDPAVTQYINGTAGDDVFVINANGEDYRWGLIDQGAGIVVWDARPDADAFDLIYDIETIQFNDGHVTADASGALVFIPGAPNNGSNPTARDDAAGVLEDGSAVTGNVLTNDEDIDGQAFSVTQVNGQAANVGQIVTLASGLKVSIDALGDFSVDPGPAYQSLAAGVDAQESISYQITDSSGAIATANLVVTITGTNDVPTVSAVTASTAEDQVVTGQLTATDPDGDQLSFAISGDTPEGLILNADGSWSFDPGDRFVDLAENESATIAFQYIATDATTTSDPAAVTITVEGKDAAPIARDDGAAVLEDGIAVSGNVLTNDEDSDGQAFNVTQVNGQTANVGQIMTLASGLKVSIDALGDFSVDPGTAYQSLAAGVDAQESIAYQITDSSGAIASANLVVTITGTNDVPVVSAVTASTAEDQIVTGQLTATDPDGDQLSFAISGDTPEGLTLNADGSWSFDPGDRFEDLAENESATIAFQYTANDATTTSDPAEVTITVQGQNAAPIARDDGAAVLEDGIAVSGNVLTNDEDIDGQAFGVTQVNGQTANVGQIMTLASGLKVSIDALGDFSVDPGTAYQNLAAGVDAQESIAYQISDSSGAIASANLVVTITGTNDVPTVSAVTASTTEDQIVTGQLTATDPDGDQLSFAISGDTPEGLTLTTDGSWSFDPGDRFVDLAENESATIAFQYTATDATGSSDPAEVTITVEGQDAAPPFLSYQDDPAVTQYLEGTDQEDAFIIAGSFQNYGWGATSDGGVVVWPHGDGPHDIVYDFEQIRFDDGFIRINTDGTLSLESYSGSGVTYNDDPAVTQYINGTAGDDVFVINANGEDYRWGLIDQGAGIVVWDARPDADAFDLIYDIETIQFNDGQVGLNDDGALEFKFAEDAGIS